jgi:hypothetical protein
MIGKLHQPVLSVFNNIDIIPNLDLVVNVVFTVSGPSLEPAVPLPAQKY